MPLMFNKLSIAGSLIGGIPETQVVIIMMRTTRSMINEFSKFAELFYILKL